MANNEINDLTAKTTPVSTDEVEIQETGGGLSKKATLSNLSKAINLDNVSSGTTNKVYTATEQTKLSGIEAGATNNTGSLADQDTVNNSDWSGTDLSVANGGTGASSHTSGNYLKGNGTSAITSSTPASVAAEIGALLYPVGSYYINETNSTNPATLLGFGTWTAVQDTFIVARGSTFTGTGGAATHTHDLSSNGYAKISASGSGAIQGRYNATSSWTRTSWSPVTVNSTSATVSSGAELGGATDSSSTIPPYQAAYVWKRTA